MSRDFKHFETLYHIIGMQPRRDMGGFGFCVKLFPSLPAAVEASGMRQQHATQWIKSFGTSLLEAHGFDADFAELYLRVTWGKWGPEHITIPGNACGLDLDDGPFKPPGGRMLSPHNVDSVRQSHLLLCIFTGLMDLLVCNQELLAMGSTPVPLAASGGVS